MKSINLFRVQDDLYINPEQIAVISITADKKTRLHMSSGDVYCLPEDLSLDEFFMMGMES